MLKFETPSRNVYAWDDEVGLFVPFSSTMEAVINEISRQGYHSKEHIIERLSEDFQVEEVAFCFDWLQKWEKVKPLNYRLEIPREFPISSIKKYLLRYGIQQLTLNVTEDCNFRCKYCTYSEYYEYMRPRSEKCMVFSVAKKAIDQFIMLLKEGKRFNPLREPSIGFYGGEPLLNFDLIRDCIEYVETIDDDFGIIYNITTNGSLLDKHKADWLMEHDFTIAVSLDGPEEEHDRNRIYSDGKGTFRNVMKNVSSIMDSGYKKIFSMAVFDWKSNLFEIEEFFNRIDVPPLMIASTVGITGGCKYYDQFSKDDYSAYLEQIKMAKNYYYEIFSEKNRSQEKDSFFDRIIGDNAKYSLFVPLSIRKFSSIVPCTGTCIPGKKIFVDYSGNFHICEKMVEINPFGNVHDGLNYEKISEIVTDYFRHMDKCPNCRVRRTCSYCYIKFATDKGFLSSSHICEEVESSSIVPFGEALMLAEINPEYVEKSAHLENLKRNWSE